MHQQMAQVRHSRSVRSKQHGLQCRRWEPIRVLPVQEFIEKEPGKLNSQETPYVKDEHIQEVSIPSSFVLRPGWGYQFTTDHFTNQRATAQSTKVN